MTCDNSPPNPTVPSTRWLALVSQRQKEGVFSFTYTFAEEGFLGHGMENDVGMVLTPLKRSVTSLQAVRRPLVPHFLWECSKALLVERRGGQGLKGIPEALRLCGRCCFNISLTQGSLEGNSLLLGTNQSPPGSR